MRKQVTNRPASLSKAPKPQQLQQQLQQTTAEMDQRIDDLRKTFSSQQQQRCRWKTVVENIHPKLKVDQPNDMMYQYLASIQMEQYHQAIIGFGITDPSKLSAKTLEQIQIPMGHQLKILKHIPAPKQTSSVSISVISQDQVACWVCYRLHTLAISSYNKNFCSAFCQKSYLLENQVRCKKCGKEHHNQDAILKFGDWYCGVECMPSEQELYMRLIKQ